MSDGLYLATNPGAILRRMFPKQLKSPLMIIVWSIVFILNIVVVVFVQNNFIYNITDFSKEALQEHSYFENCEIISVEEYIDNYVIYQNEDGEKRVVRLAMFPGKILKRATIDKAYDRVASEDGSIELKEDIWDKWPWVGSIDAIVIMYIALGAGMLLIEFFLYDVFHRLFRE